MKIHNNFILSFCVLGLLLLCFFSIYTPIGFEKEQHRREAIVRQRMKHIQQAEQRYLQRHFVYTADFHNLVAEGLLADSLQYIPFAPNRKFKLQASVEVTKSGRQMPQLQCQANYEDYLQGLDDERIAKLIEEATAKGLFPGLELSN